MQAIEKKKVQAKKKTGYNVYGVKDKTFRILAGLLVGVTAASVLDTMLPFVPQGLRLIPEAVLVILVVGVLLLKSRATKNRIEAYRRTEGFSFLGLYNIAVVKDLESDDILSREAEAAYIRQTLEDLVFPQKTIKQAVCLTGTSGCGKSTILSFFRKMYGDDYLIYDMTDNYPNFKMILETHLGENVKNSLEEKVRNKKVVFILDQFERYFFLDEQKKREVRDLIMLIARKNTALILSMREEYLADFMKEFNVNNLKVLGRDRQNGNESGILNDLVSTIKDSDKNYFILSDKSQEKAADEWNGGLIKTNQHIHLEHIGAAFEDAVLEQVGNTIFYCENQNDAHTQENAEDRFGMTKLERKCELQLGEDGKHYYEKHKTEPLIEQQIFYHMAEYERKRKNATDEMLLEMYDLESYELLNQYFDIQLTSTDDYYNASRILYLLSTARMHQVVMKKTDLIFGLNPDYLSPEGHKQLTKVLEELVDLQLIRQTVKDSDLEYEIAHDFIAQSYLNYSSSNIDRNVRGALDIYLSEYLDTSKAEGIRAKREFFKRVHQSGFYRNLTITFAILAVIAYAFVNLGYNPWTHGLSAWNAYGDVRSLFPLFGTEMSLIYLFCMYNKVFRFCRGKKEKGCKITYVIIMFGTLITMFAYPHNMLCIGAFLAVMGFFGAFLLDGTYQRASRMELRNYGLKCALMGIAFIFFHLVIWAFNPVIPRYLIVVEMIMTCILIGYAFMAHMTRENLYGRLMDASSERTLQE